VNKMKSMGRALIYSHFVNSSIGAPHAFLFSHASILPNYFRTSLK